MWWNKYIGIPYQDKGRSHSGVDCWGLAKLVYEEEFKINLPSFATEYSNDDPDRIGELISQYTEGWEPSDTPVSGTLVLFRILGVDSHIGIMVNETQFIHSREGKDVVIESIASGTWKHRVSGFYSYKKNTGALLAAVPNALKTERIDMYVPEGITVGELVEWINKEKNVPQELASRIVILIDGTPIDVVACKDLILKGGQRIEYRALPGKSAMKFVLIIGVMTLAASMAPGIASALAGVSGEAATSWLATGMGKFATFAAQAAIGMVGTALVNAIFPVRQPAMPTDPGTSTPQLMLTGGRNSANQYGAVPVVLGQYRFIAPLAASNYVVTLNDISYLKMLLIWGYGPLAVEDIKIGANPINTYDDVKNVTVYGNSTETTALADMHALYGPDTYQEAPGLTLTYVGTTADWITRRISGQKVDGITVTLNFPEGLRGLYREGKLAGQQLAALFTGEAQIQELDDTLTPVGSWKGIGQYVNPTSLSIPVAYRTVATTITIGTGDTSYTVQSTVEQAAYRWTRIVYNIDGTLSIVNGFPFPNISDTTVESGFYSYPGTSQDAGLADPVWTSTGVVNTLPPVGPGQFVVWDVLVYTNTISSSTSANRTLTMTGGALTFSGLIANVAAISVTAATIAYGGSGQSYYLRKDGFSSTIQFNNLPLAYYDIRVRRTNSADSEGSSGLTGKPYLYHKAVWNLLTGSNSTLRAVTLPVNTYFAMTALNIKATDQLNGSIEGINALVKSICLDYTGTPGSWTARPTRNPASLFRYMLQHPGNSQAISAAEVSTKIDLTALEDWHNYCTTNGFTFDAVITDRRSLLDILRDICAAGRASPLLVGGKWTVIIDRARSNIIQHFTPHNSYGFEGNKTLTVQPHALRVTFINSLREYQAEELIVYNEKPVLVTATTLNSNSSVTVNSITGLTVGSYVISGSLIPITSYITGIPDSTHITLNTGVGVVAGTGQIYFGVKYTAATATVFEALELPGVTLSMAAYRHARFHLAQARLRPEVYSLSTDMEHIVCTRGDLVRVTHDTPMWGLSTGRIKTNPTTTTITIDEPVILTFGTTYTIRIRLEDGSSITRTLATIPATAEYTTLTLASTITATQGATGNLFMVGTLNSESVELIVLSIEPANNLTAKITLVDYAPSLYTIDTTPIPLFNTHVYQAPMYARNFILTTPVVVSANIKSDESVMELSGGSYIYKISIPYSNPSPFNNTITHVEARICLTNDTSVSWRKSEMFPVNSGNVVFSDVEEGISYAVQLRYVSGIGFTGPWSTEVNHVIVGKSTPPSVVGIITAAAEGVKIRLSWPKNGELDLAGYEVRLTDSGWGTAGALYVGTDASCLVDPAALGVSRTWYIRAFDSATTVNYSATSSSYTTTVTGPGAPLSLTAKLTLSSAIFTWLPPSSSLFAIRGYNVTLTAAGMTTITATRDTTDWEVPVNWTGTATLTVVPLDVLGNTYIGTSNTITLAKTDPTTPSLPAQSVVGTDLFLDWSNNTIASNQLEVVSYEIKQGATSIWRGTASQAYISLIGKSGTINYNLYAIDYNGVVSAARAISYTIISPTNIANDTTFTGSFGTSLADTSLSLSWTNVSTAYGLAGYKVYYDSVVTFVASNTLTISPLPTGWIGNKTFTIKTVDLLGNESTGTSKIISKSLPGPITGANAQVIDNNVMLYWTPPSRTSLPIAYIRLKKDGVDIGKKDGTFTTIFERAAGTFVYSLSAVDTDGQEGTSASLSVTVSAPPDFLFNADKTSNFTTGFSITKTSAALDNGTIVLPVNTTETYAQHFTSLRVTAMSVSASGSGYAVGDTFRLNTGTNTYPAKGTVTGVSSGAVTSVLLTDGGNYTVAPSSPGATIKLTGSGNDALTISPTTGGNWASPSAQVSAGFPVYIQPSLATGIYEEIFDLGTVYTSSQITLTYVGTTISGTVSVVTDLTYSSDNSTYTPAYPGTVLFGTNIRYVKVKVIVSQTDANQGLYKLSYLNVRLDSKIKNDSGSVSCVSTHTDGTSFNFNKEFVKINSITLTPSGTTRLTAVYDYTDLAAISGTYTITSNSCVVTASGHGFSQATGAIGQNVKLSFSSGGAPSGIYPITAVSGSTFTVAITTANTSGNVSIYSQGARAYLFDSAGSRTTGNVSWAVRGY